MGLDAIVGAFVELELDEDDRESLREQFVRLGEALRAAGHGEYIEPEKLPAGRSWSARIGHYGGIHHLRRLAAYVWAGMALPDPTEDAAQDPLLQQLYSAELEGTRPAWRRLLSPPKFPGNTFAHLVHHSDAEGFYVPIDFRIPLVPDPSLEVAGGWIGSSVRLRRECEQLAGLLQLPLDADPESDEFQEMLTNPPPTGALWQQYAAESYVCLQLYRGARASIESGAALIFC